MLIQHKLDARVPFHGVRMTMFLDSLEEEDFRWTASEDFVEPTFDAAEVHDLSPGGKASLPSSPMITSLSPAKRVQGS